MSRLALNIGDFARVHGATSSSFLEITVNALSQLPGRVTALQTRLTAVETEHVALHGEFVTFRTMRVLHEKVISRIALLQEGLTKSHSGTADN